MARSWLVYDDIKQTDAQFDEEDCGKMFELLENLESRRQEVCDICGATIEYRGDDCHCPNGCFIFIFH